MDSVSSPRFHSIDEEAAEGGHIEMAPAGGGDGGLHPPGINRRVSHSASAGALPGVNSNIQGMSPLHVTVQTQPSPRHAAAADGTTPRQLPFQAPPSAIPGRRFSRVSFSPMARRFSRQQSMIKSKITDSWPGSNHIRRLFRLFDKDGNGAISNHEFRSGLETLGFDVSAASDLNMLHAQLDKDKSGEIKETQFIHVFRTLNRAAIEAKLKEGAAKHKSKGASAASMIPAPVDAQVEHTHIQLVKIGHAHAADACSPYSSPVRGAASPASAPAAAGAGAAGAGGAGAAGGRSPSPFLSSGALSPGEVGVNFQHVPSVAVEELADLLRAEEAESLREGKHKAIRWIDIVGYHRGVLDLLSNFYLLPHEMLGEEIELESAAHCDFYTGRPDPTIIAAAGAGVEQQSAVRAGGRGVAAPSASADPAPPTMTDVTTAASATTGAAGAGAAAAHRAQSSVKDASDSPPPMMAPADLYSAASPEVSQVMQQDEGGYIVDTSLPPLTQHTLAPSASSSSHLALGATPAHALRRNASESLSTRSTSASASASASSSNSHSHSTLKLLLHSIQLRNFPLVDSESSDDDDDRAPVSGAPTRSAPGRRFGIPAVLTPDDDGDRLELIPFRTYKKHRPDLRVTPLHVVVANSHTLITVRPWVDPRGEDGQGLRGDTTAAVHAAQANGHAADTLGVFSDGDPNRMMDDLIASLSDVDPTSRSSSLGLTSSLQLLMRVWEDLVDSNWAVRDLMKEWKIHLSNHEDKTASAYHTMQLRDLDRLAGNFVRQLKPLVAATALLSEHGADHGISGSGRGSGGGLHSRRAIPGVLSSHSASLTALANEAARSAYLASINPALRVLHRAIHRQWEQANLTVSLVKGLQEQFIQKGRDKANDTLYILTVVSVVVTPLQIMCGVYGMNFDNLPELHYENGYYWFWILNLIGIVIIACWFWFMSRR